MKKTLKPNQVRVRTFSPDGLHTGFVTMVRAREFCARGEAQFIGKDLHFIPPEQRPKVTRAKPEPRFVPLRPPLRSLCEAVA